MFLMFLPALAILIMSLPFIPLAKGTEQAVILTKEIIMIKMPKDTDFSYKEKRSNKQLFIDRFYQEYLSEKHAYGETFKTKATWQKENKDFIDKKYAEENSES